MKESNRMQYIQLGSDVAVLPLLSAVLDRQSRWFQGSSDPGDLTTIHLHLRLFCKIITGRSCFWVNRVFYFLIICVEIRTVEMSL